MTYNTEFFKTYYYKQRGWMLKNSPFKMLRGSEVKIIDKENNITPGIQKVFTYTSYITAKLMINMENLVFRVLILQKLFFLTVYQKKDVCQIVINILKTILIIM